MQEIKEKFKEVSSKPPKYLSDYEYSLIAGEYHHTKQVILQLLSNLILTNKQIDMIIERIDDNIFHIRKILGDRIAMTIIVDLNVYVDKILADCIDDELYESAENLNKIKNILHL